GNANYLPSPPSACEPFHVIRHASTTVTELHNPDHSVIPLGSNIPLNSTVHDSATVSQLVTGFPITGTVTFTFFRNATCTDTGEAAGTVTLDANRVADPSTSFGPLATGDYSFRATYNGNANYLPSTSACEPFHVVPRATT